MNQHQPGILAPVPPLARPVTGACFWCPPMAGGHLDLTALGL